jgi:hypothetical protein
MFSEVPQVFGRYSNRFEEAGVQSLAHYVRFSQEDRRLCMCSTRAI